MSLIQKILYTVSNYPGGYRILYDILYDGKSPDQSEESFNNNLRSTLSKMKRKGLLKKSNDKWTITREGVEFLELKNSGIKTFFPKKAGKRASRKKDMIIIFDIPEKIKNYRDWLRSELVGFEFEQVQKSVWLGPKLPKEFIEYLDEIDLLKYVRFFHVNKSDLI